MATDTPVDLEIWELSHTPPSANVDIYWKNYETRKGRTDELSHHQKTCVWNKDEGITKNWLHCTLPMYVERLGLSWFFVNCYALFNRVVSLWHSSSRTCVISRGKVPFLAAPLPNADFLSSYWFMRLWEGQPFRFENF